MIVSKLMHTILRPYRAPEPGDDGAGGDDRGDNFQANDDPYPDGSKGDGGKSAKDASDLDDKDDDEKDDKDGDDKDDADDKGDKDDKDNADDKDEKDDDKKARKDSRIPVSRHKEILAKEREKRAELERRLQAHQHGQQVASTNEQITKAEEQLLTKETEYNKAMIAGDADKATALMREIRTLERSIGEAKTQMSSEAAVAQATEKVRYQLTVERLEEAYPQLNPDSETFDEDLSADVVDLMNSYIARRNMTPAQAIQKAVKRLVGEPKNKAQERATEAKARVESDDVKAQLAKDRKAEAVKRNVDVAGKQPKSLKDVGTDSDKAGGGITAQSVMKMTQTDFSKLDEATLARLRGDVLA